MRRNARRGQAIGGGPRAPPGSWSLLRTNTSQHGGKTATEDRGGSNRDVPPLGATGSAGDMAHPRMQHSGSLSWSPPPCAVSEWLAPVTQSELPNASNGRISRGWPRGPRTARRACRRQPAPALGAIPSVVSPSSNLHFGAAIIRQIDEPPKPIIVPDQQPLVSERRAQSPQTCILLTREAWRVSIRVGCEFRGSGARRSKRIFRSSACSDASEPLQRMPVVNFDHPTLHCDARLAERRKGA